MAKEASLGVVLRFWWLFQTVLGEVSLLENCLDAGRTFDLWDILALWDISRGPVSRMGIRFAYTNLYFWLLETLTIAFHIFHSSR